MNNFKYIYLTFILFSVISCNNNDDFSRKYIDNEVKTELLGIIELDRMVAAPTTLVSFNFTLPQSLSYESTVEVSATTFDYDNTKVHIVVPAGETSGSGTIKMPGEGTISNSFSGIDNFAEISLTGIAINQPSEGDLIDDPYTLTSDSHMVRLVDYNGTYMSPRDDAMKILMDWQGPYGNGENDVDMYVFNADTFAMVESATSGSRYEGDWFNDFHPDGNYFVAVDFYSTLGGDLPYSFTFTKPDGTVDYYEDKFIESENLGFEYPIINISKTTDSEGNVTYTTSLP